jgi:hypothetical protein
MPGAFKKTIFAAPKQNLPDSVWFINQIRLLYKIEDHVRDMISPERQIFRHENAPVIWKASKSRTEELQPKFLPKSTMGKAISYFIDEYDALTRSSSASGRVSC